ncbi:MAG: hypothetical protein KGQ59_00655 [Bdellovibrionales bacterium]|nr:hypothetical protein [Bdellovibrionales bacterium]
MKIARVQRTVLRIVAFLVISAPSAFAADYDVCICQTGTMNPVEVGRGETPLYGTGNRGEEGIYWLGCKAYLASTRCKKTYVIPVDKDIQGILNQHAGGRANLSYVGHWDSSENEVKFLKTHVVPALKSSGCTIDVYNSACRAGNNGYEIYDFLKSLGPIGEKLRFQGNQAISTGIWDPIAPGKNNFPVHVDSKGVHFPRCQEFKGRGCNVITNGQSGEVGVCENPDGKTEFLACITMKERASGPRSSGVGKPGQGGSIHSRRSSVSTTEWRSLSDPQVLAEFKRSIPATLERNERELRRAVKDAALKESPAIAALPEEQQVEVYEDWKPQGVSRIRLAGLFGNLQFESLEQIEKFIDNLKRTDPREFLKNRARECRD